MAIDPKNINSEDEFRKLGDDATATFDNSSSNPTEHASSENLGAQASEDEDDIEEEGDDELDDEDIEDDEDDEDVDEEDADEEENDDLITDPKAPSAYRML